MCYLHVSPSCHHLARATLAQKPLLQDRLDVAAAVQHAMYTDGLGFEGVDDAVGFVMQFSELCHANLEEFHGDLAAQREFPGLQACSSEGGKQSVCAFHRIVHRNERVDVEEIVLGIVVEHHVIVFHA